MVTKNLERIGAASAARLALAQTFLCAVALSLGCGMVVAALQLIAPSASVYILFFGLLVVLITFIILGRLYISSLNKIAEFSGVFVHNKKNRLPIKIFRYKLSEDMADNILALTRENKALGRIWENGNFFDRPNGKLKMNESGKIGHEALEYCIIRRLSMSLSKHMNRSTLDGSLLQSLKRNDLPSVLLNNRFVDLFSRPMQEREAFAHRKSDDTLGQVVTAWGKGGEIYNRLELILPKYSNVSRLENGDLNISTKRISMRIHVNFGPFNAVLPRRFEELYLRKNLLSVSVIKCEIAISFKISIWWMFSNKGWEYYEWVDGFLKDVEELVSFDSFVESIGWNGALTTFHIQGQSVVAPQEGPVAERSPPPAEGTGPDPGQG